MQTDISSFSPDGSHPVELGLNFIILHVNILMPYSLIIEESLRGLAANPLPPQEQ